MMIMNRLTRWTTLGALGILLALPPALNTPAQETPAPAPAPRNTPTPPSQASRPQQPSTSQSTAAPRPTRAVRSSTPSGASSAGRADGKYVPPEFKIQADTDAAVLLIEPVDVRAQVGEEFRTDITLINPRSLSYEGMALALQYDPKVLEPIRINTHHSDTFLDQTTKDAQVYAKQGIVTFRGKFKSELTNVDMPLISVRWKALAENSFSTIKFIQLPGETAGILNKAGSDILGGMETEGDGYLSASVVVDNPLAGEAAWLSPAVTKSGIELSTQYEILGDVFDIGTPIRVDVMMANPEKAPLSIVNIEMKFDPEYLEVMDWDKDNWISLGTNVNDGGYKENFNFTYHMSNRVINTTGDIIYKMGTVSEQAVRIGPDPVFSILFQVKKPFSQTDVDFKMPSTIYEDGTRVTYLGNDVLGSSVQPGDGARNLSIRPR